jgi:hypothetical protein
MLVEQRRSRELEIIKERLGVSRRGPALVDGLPHVAQPGGPLSRPDAEAHVSHAQTRMPALLAVRVRTAPVLHQKQRKPPFWGFQVGRIQSPQDGIGLDTGVEAFDERGEKRLAPDTVVEAVFVCFEVGERDARVYGFRTAVRPAYQ